MVLNTELLNVPQGNHSRRICSTAPHGDGKLLPSVESEAEKGAGGRVKGEEVKKKLRERGGRCVKAKNQIANNHFDSRVLGNTVKQY